MRATSPSTASRSEHLSGLAELRRRLRASAIPPAREGNLRLATWNIRELGKVPRWDESIALLAATVASFDLVSVVELRDDLGDLHRMLAHLGPWWRAIFSDYRLDAGGNRERVGFLYDSRRITFTGLASHAEGERTRHGDEYRQAVPWWRPPFLASFQAGHLPFVLVAAHVRWGRTVVGREQEVAALASWATTRSAERSFEQQDFVLVGDFNVPSQRSWVWEKLKEAGFSVPAGLEGDPGSNLARGKRYDRMFWKGRGATPRFTGRAGAADFYAGDHAGLLPERRLSKEAFTFQMSDHLPVWVKVARQQIPTLPPEKAFVANGRGLHTPNCLKHE